jgi:hypothetical protein
MLVNEKESIREKASQEQYTNLTSFFELRIPNSTDYSNLLDYLKTRLIIFIFYDLSQLLIYLKDNLEYFSSNYLTNFKLNSSFFIELFNLASFEIKIFILLCILWSFIIVSTYISWKIFSPIINNFKFNKIELEKYVISEETIR